MRAKKQKRMLRRQMRPEMVESDRPEAWLSGVFYLIWMIGGEMDEVRDKA